VTQHDDSYARCIIILTGYQHADLPFRIECVVGGSATVCELHMNGTVSNLTGFITNLDRAKIIDMSPGMFVPISRSKPT